MSNNNDDDDDDNINDLVMMAMPFIKTHIQKKHKMSNIEITELLGDDTNNFNNGNIDKNYLYRCFQLISERARTWKKKKILFFKLFIVNKIVSI